MAGTAIFFSGGAAGILGERIFMLSKESKSSSSTRSDASNHISGNHRQYRWWLGTYLTAYDGVTGGPKRVGRVAIPAGPVWCVFHGLRQRSRVIFTFRTLRDGGVTGFSPAEPLFLAQIADYFFGHFDGTFVNHSFAVVYTWKNFRAIGEGGCSRCLPPCERMVLVRPEKVLSGRIKSEHSRNKERSVHYEKSSGNSSSTNYPAGPRHGTGGRKTWRHD